MTSALEVIFNEMRYINLRFTYLLTYLLILEDLAGRNGSVYSSGVVAMTVKVTFML